MHEIMWHISYFSKKNISDVMVSSLLYVEVNFMRKFIYTQICKRGSKTMQRPENLCGKSAKGKNHGAKRDFTKSKGLQWALHTLLQIQFLRVRSL